MENTILSAVPELIIALEYAPGCMRDLGFKPDEVLSFFRDKQYLLYVLDRKGNLELADNQTIEARAATRGYVDLIISGKALLTHDA